MPLGAVTRDGLETADQLERDNPGWAVVHGTYSRQYVAFPLYQEARERCCLVAEDPGDLARLIQEAELRHGRSR